uniref:Uncharacterized protein n=2 Tax=Timema TaxID=61471 RepID=A0A7R8VHQ9_TIMDO|nr:unnamed protein product [Timema douglasi]
MPVVFYFCLVEPPNCCQSSGSTHCLIDEEGCDITQGRELFLSCRATKLALRRTSTKVITTIGPAKPQRSTSNNNSAVTSLEHLDSERCHLLALNNPMPGSPKAATPPHKLCLETSFTSLQSPTTDAQCSVSPHSSTCSHLIVSGNRTLKPAYASSPFALHPVLSWEYAAILEEHHANNGIILGRSKNDNDQKTLKLDLIHDDWFGLAPLATPESLSEVSSISSRAKEDVSFESAQENDEDVPQFTQSNSSLNNDNSSEVFSSVKGTPFTSVHQLLINRKDVISLRLLNKTTFTRPSSVSNILDDTWHSDLTVSSSPKKTKFFTPQNSFNSNECSTEKFSTPENYPRYQSTSSQEKLSRIQKSSCEDHYDFAPRRDQHSATRSPSDACQTNDPTISIYRTEFLDLKYDCEAKIIFKQSGHELVWVKHMNTYPQLWGKTEPLLISFPSTCLVLLSSSSQNKEIIRRLINVASILRKSERIFLVGEAVRTTSDTSCPPVPSCREIFLGGAVRRCGEYHVQYCMAGHRSLREESFFLGGAAVSDTPNTPGPPVPSTEQKEIEKDVITQLMIGACGVWKRGGSKTRRHDSGARGSWERT